VNSMSSHYIGCVPSAPSVTGALSSRLWSLCTRIGHSRRRRCGSASECVGVGGALCLALTRPGRTRTAPTANGSAPSVVLRRGEGGPKERGQPVDHRPLDLCPRPLPFALWTHALREGVGGRGRTGPASAWPSMDVVEHCDHGLGDVGPA